MNSKIRSVRTSRSALIGGILLLIPACAPSSGPANAGTGGKTAGTGGATGSGGTTGSGGGNGTGGSPLGTGGGTGSGGAGTGGSGTGGSGTGSGGVSGGGTNGSGGGAGGNRDAAADAPATDGGASDVVVRDGATTDAGAYVRTGWTAAYTCTNPPCPASDAADVGDIPTNAFDGNIQTRWSTGQFQSALRTMNKFPLYFTVDMKQVMNVSKITMHPSCKDIFDSPGTIEIFLSVDGTNFGTAVAPVHTPAVPPANEACPPTATAVATDTVTFPQTAARFIQIKGTQRTTSDRFWAIGEMNVYP